MCGLYTIVSVGMYVCAWSGDHSLLDHTSPYFMYLFVSLFLKQYFSLNLGISDSTRSASELWGPGMAVSTVPPLPPILSF